MVVTSAVSIRLLANRTLNQLRCWTSYALSLFGVVRVRHLPTFVSVEPANFCQLRCPECPVGIASSPNRLSPHLLMPLSIFERVLEQVQSTAHTMQFYFQGEPLLNKQLPEMIAMAHKVGLYTIVSTNAQTLSRCTAEALVKSGLNRIIVSIDGFSEESYAAYRVGGSLHEWGWIKKNYKKLGATHLVFKTAQLYDFEHGHPLMPSNERYSRYRKTANGTYVHKKTHQLFSLPFREGMGIGLCLRLWSGCVITTNGDVLPCCYDKNHRHAYGNITQQSLAELYHSTKAKALRLRVLRHQGEKLEMCKNCNQ